MFDFIRVMDQQSQVLIGKKRVWELLRGVYNDNFNKIAKEKGKRKLLKIYGIFIMKI